MLLPFAEARGVFDRAYVTRVLADSGGNRSEAARRLEMSKSTFWDLLKRLSLSPDTM
ncbi:MAG: hypothetical protein JKY37_26765 [Nannocystaceae bacterium]|nr:hypothetical protein [Nannocystaceae bacterium]